MHKDARLGQSKRSYQVAADSLMSCQEEERSHANYGSSRRLSLGKEITVVIWGRVYIIHTWHCYARALEAYA